MGIKKRIKGKVKDKAKGKENKVNGSGVKILVPVEEMILMYKIIAKNEEVIETLEKKLKQKEEACEYYRVLSERRKLNC